MRFQKLRDWRLINTPEVRFLDWLCFPTCKHFRSRPGDHWWVVTDRGRVVAFAGLRLHKSGYAELTRCGVAPWARGRGLQRELIRRRVSWARRKGCTRVWTYTFKRNSQSRRNLVASGFEFSPSEDGQWLNFRLEL